MKKNNYYLSILVRMVLIIICFCANAISRQLNCNTVVMLCTISYAIITLFTNCEYLIKYISLVLPAGLAILGTFIIEKDTIWLHELSKYSYYAGSLPLISGFYLTFLCSLEMFDKYFVVRKRDSIELNIHYRRINVLNTLIDASCIALLLVTLIMCLRIMHHPAFLNGMDRFLYKSRFVNGIWRKLDDYYFYFLPILLIGWHIGKCRKVTIVTLLLYVVYLVMTGEKYGKFVALIMFCAMYFIPVYMYQNSKVIKRLFAITVLTLILAVTIVLLQYSNYTWTTPLEHFEQRIAQQGQLWWSIYDRQADTSIKFSELADETSKKVHQDGKSPYYGIYKIMFLSAPYDQVKNKIASGSTYTESTAASLYYYLGSIPLILFAVNMGVFFSFLAHKFVEYIKKKCVLEAIVVARLIFLGRSFLGNSDFVGFFEIETLFTIIVWIMCAFVRRRVKTKKRVLDFSMANKEV